ncbi:hypothetical protein AB0H83_10020 [Dactylosporangium sp. NPDC050688]|uniref:hypothetical protein n=1 Tax=Dactylosporangium sp. NPDC050688 TaxID=3157217 RepID=UPI0033F3A198
MDEVVVRRTVSFAGEGAGSGELSWGQLDVWLKMRRLGRTFAMGGARAMPAGATVEDVAGPGSEFTWVSAHDDPQSGFFLSVDGTDEALEMTLYADSHFLAPGDAAAVLWAMDETAARHSAASSSGCRTRPPSRAASAPG